MADYRLMRCAEIYGLDEVGLFLVGRSGHLPMSVNVK